MKKINCLSWRSLLLSSLAVASLFFQAASYGATRTWSGGGADDFWGTALNWDTLPVSGDSLIFTGTSRLLNTNNQTLTGVAGIRFSTNGFVLRGNSFPLTTSAITNSVGTNTIGMNLSWGLAGTLHAEPNTELVIGGILTNTFAAGSSNVVYKGGGRVRFTGGYNQANNNPATIINNAEVVVDGGTFTNAGGFRLASDPSAASSKMILTNGAIMSQTIQGGAMRIGDLTGITGQFEMHNSRLFLVSNLINIPFVNGATGNFTQRGGTNTGGVVNFIHGGTSGTGSYDMIGGVLGTHRIQKENAVGTATISFDGATILVLTNTTTFFTGIDLATINSGGLTIDNNGFNVTIGQDFAGTGGLTKTGSGTLTMGAGSTNTGGFTLSAGTMAVSANNALGKGAVNLNGGTLQGNNATARSATNVVSIGGNTTIGGTAAITLSGSISMGANLTVTSTAGATLSGAVTLTGNRTITVTAVTNTWSGSIGEDTGGRGLTKAGTGILVLSGTANSYSGSTTISNGILQVNATSTLGNGTGTIVLAGGNLQCGASRTVATANPLDLTADSTISSTAGAATPGFEFSSDSIGGAAGTLTFTNASGVLNSTFGPRFSGSGFNFARPIVLTSSSTNSTQLSLFNTNGTEQTFSGSISGIGSINRSQTLNGGSSILAVSNSFSGGVTLTRGSIGVGNNFALGTGIITPNGGGIFASGASRSVTNNFTFSSGLTVGGTNDISFTGTFDLNTNNRTLTVTNTALSTISGSVISSVAATTNALTKAGSGVLVISSANSYAGDTVISAGTLRLSNVSGSALGSGNVIVASGATLSGTGSVSGAVTNSGTLMPGASPGTLSTGSEDWSGGGSYVWEMNDATGTAGASPGWDKIAITGGLNISATPSSKFTINITSLTNSSPGDAVNFDNSTDHTWIIATTTTGVTGFSANSFTLATNNFSNAQGSGVFNIAVSGNDLVLKFVHPPTITNGPANLTKTVGESATFTVETDALTYQWRKNSANISGATDSSYVISSVVTADAGSYDVVVANGSGSLASSAATLTVNKADQTINFGALSGKTYGDADFEVSATSSSGLPVSFSIFSGSATIVNATNVHLTGTGNVTVRASQAGNADTNAAPVVDQTFNVAKKALTVTTDSTNRFYGSTNPAFTVTYTGLTNGDTAAVISGSPVFSTDADTNSPVAGNPYYVTNSVGTLTAANYDFTTFVPGTLMIDPAPLVVTASLTKAYGATNPPLDPTYIGFVNGEGTNVLTGSPILTTSADTNSTVAGSPYLVTVVTNDLASPNYSITASNGTLAVTAAALTITSDSTNRVYGASNPAFTGSLSGLQNGDNITATYSTTADTNSAVGGYAITQTLSDPDTKLGNYTVTTNNGTLTVTAVALTITSDSTNRIYGASNPAFTGSLSGLQNGDNITATYSTTADTNSAIGGYAITQTLSDPDTKLGNYTVVTNNGTLTITAAALTITSDNTNRVYGAANPAFTGSLSGLQNNDNITATYSTTADTNSPIGGYAITQTLSDPDTRLGNYTVTTNNGTLTVTVAALTITSDSTNRAYGAANPAFTGSLTGLQNNDNITATYSTTADTNSPVGNYDITQALTDPDTKLVNYTVTTNNGTLTITSSALTFASDSTNRTYGAANPTFTGSITGLQNGDSITATYSTTADTNSPVGGYTITQTISDPGSKIGNYTAVTNDGTLTVTAASLTVTADNQTRATGQANPVFTGVINGIQNNDNITATYSSTADNLSPAGTYAIIPELVDPDTKLGNYGVTTNHGTLTVIDAPLITLQPVNVTTSYLATVTFSVTATGGGTLTYQWQHESNNIVDGGIISGASSATLNLTGVTVAELGNYRVIVSNVVGSATSSNATLTLVGGVTITNQPASLPELDQGASATFSVGATGGALSYQWYIGASPISGATDSSYTRTNVQPSDAGPNFSVVVSNPGGSVTSSNATITAVFLDGDLPTVKVITPASKKGTNQAMINVTGQAKDKKGIGSGIVTSVVVVHNAGVPGGTTNAASLLEFGSSATEGKFNFSSPITLTAGTNTLLVYATDLAGNTSAVSTATSYFFFYDVTNNLTLEIGGTGSVKGAITTYSTTTVIPNYYKVGRPYAFDAFVGAGTNYVFTNWATSPTNIGYAVTNWVQKNKLLFVMQPEMTIHAGFLANPFTPVAGIYNGLFSEPTNAGGVRHESAGFVSVKVGAKSGYSGYLVFDGDPKVTFSGKFTASGDVTRDVRRDLKFGKAPVRVSLALDWSTSSGEITGTVTNGTWTSELLANLAKFDAKALPPVLDSTNFMGRYTMQIPRGAGSPASAPGGVGYGTITNNAAGIITLAGKLGDGGPKQAIQQKVNIGRNGDWPLYVGLYPSTVTISNALTLNLPVLNKSYYHGALMGWVKFTSNNAALPVQTNGLTGDVIWIKTAIDTNVYALKVPTNAVYYTNGFSNEISLVTSPYVPPGLNSLPIELAGGEVVVSDGDLAEPITNAATAILTNKIFLAPLTTNSLAIVTTNKMAITIAKKDGSFKGSYLRPGDALKAEFFGALLQNTTNAQGHFLGATNTSGHVIFNGP